MVLRNWKPSLRNIKAEFIELAKECTLILKRACVCIKIRFSLQSKSQSILRLPTCCAATLSEKAFLPHWATYGPWKCYLARKASVFNGLAALGYENPRAVKFCYLQAVFPNRGVSNSHAHNQGWYLFQFEKRCQPFFISGCNTKL